MTTNDPYSSTSRRNILKTGAALAGAGTLGGLAVRDWHHSVPPVVGSTEAKPQTEHRSQGVGIAAGANFLQMFAGGSPLLIARGDALSTDDGIRAGWSIPMLPMFGREGDPLGPEGILVFIPERLAENGSVELKDMLVMTSIRITGYYKSNPSEARVTMDGMWIPGDQFFPGDLWYPRERWFPTKFFVASEGVDAVRVLMFSDKNWSVTQPVPDEWFSNTQDLRKLTERAETIEAGEPLGKVTEEYLVLFAASGEHFFPDDSPVRKAGPFSWEELVNAETAQPGGIHQG